MKLLFVSNLYPPHHLGGYELLCHEVAARLIARGHDVQVLTSTFGVRTETAEPGIYRRLLLESDVYYYRPQQLLRYRSIQSHNRQAVERTLREVAPDAVIVWGMWNLTKHVTQQLEELNGLPVLYYLASSWPIELSAHEAYWDNSRDDAALGRSFKQIFRGIVKAGLRSEWRPYPLRYDHVLACCQSVCEELAAARVRTGDMAVVFHGVDAELYTRAAQQVKAPHAVKTLAVLALQLGPGPLEVGMPGHQCLIVMRADVVPIFHDEDILHRRAQLRDRGQHAVREDIFLRPRIRGSHAVVAANSMHERDPAFF